MRRFRVFGGWLVSAATIVCCGCDSTGGAPPAESSTAQGTVQGKVTRKGKPVSKVSVSFNPANVNRKTAPTAVVPVKDDGTYEVTTLVGDNRVTITGAGLGKDVQAQYYSKTIDVKAGSGNTLDIDLP